MIYSAAEPQAVTRYTDLNGIDHRTRDEAIDANFKFDVQRSVDEIINLSGLSMTPSDGAALLERMADEHPDLLRILVGDRDAT